jgi:multisubunit Na+/H+ antiporter MnhB subunit
MRDRERALFCLLAGGGDAVTGLLLVAAPSLVLHLLGLRSPDGDLILLRFVGVFVGCVGLAYLYPWFLQRNRERRIVSALEITAGVRLAVALFLGVAVATDQLALPWAAVGTYDAVVALIQLGLLIFGGLGHAD